ncbi:MAG: transglycosylase domain-containing protein [Clostridiales bacterium]|nr:transglycosylase domain-containing protein [Clostridiales bacterium]
MRGRYCFRGYKGKVHRLRWRSFFLAAFTIGFTVLSLAVTFVFSREAWRQLDISKITDAPQSLLVYDRDGQEISCLYNVENRIPISADDLPAHVIYAFVAAEDARFFSHPGFDIIRIGGAALRDLQTMSYAEGASTITQQLIKLSHLTADKDMTRKIDEAILAYQLERRYSKMGILELYLNYVYFGSGCHGIEAAARTYFGVHAAELSLSQSALLAGVLKSPSRFAPHLRPEASVGRRNVILGLMADYGFVTPEQAQLAKGDPLVLTSNSINGNRGYYVDFALTTACETLEIDMLALLSGGYRIYTKMDPELQSLCEEVFARDEYFPPVNVLSPTGETVEERPSAAIVIVGAEDGGVAAILGGRESHIALAYNRATRIRRQPGSAIKPVLVYAPALLSGYTAATMLLDEQITYDDYEPQNANGAYTGWVTMREAVTRSLNVPAVSVFSALGVERCKRFATEVGIPFAARDTRLALSLGGFTYGVSPWQLAGAYASFAGGGIYHEPYAVSEIRGSDGAMLYTHDTKGKRVMDTGSAFVLTSMLQSVVETGTAKRLADLRLGLAAKTGTVGDSAGNRDIWLAAYNPQYAAVVWMGFDEATGGRMLPPDSGGGSYPAELLHEVFARIYESEPAPQFVVPDTVTRVRLDGYTLHNNYEVVLASALTPDSAAVYEYFVRGTEPRRFTDYWVTPPPPADLTVTHKNGVVTLSFTPLSPHIEYYVYREDAYGYAVLIKTVSDTTEPQRVTDSVLNLMGYYSYYVIPVHSVLSAEGTPLVGQASERAGVWLYPTY